MLAYLIQIFFYRFVQIILFKLMYSSAFQVYVIAIDRQRTFFQLLQFLMVFIVQLSMFTLLLKKVYFKKYLRWLIGLRQTINPFVGILVVMIPIALYAYYYNRYPGEFLEYADEALALFIVFFFLGALTEELIFRGYFYRLMIIKNRKHALYLVVFQAFLFTIMHFNNPSHTYTRIGILFIAGLFLGIIALRGFIYAVLFHFLWNFLQAYMLGINVSGYRFTGSLTSYPGAPAWENNIYSGAFLALAGLVIVALHYWSRRTPGRKLTRNLTRNLI